MVYVPPLVGPRGCTEHMLAEGGCDPDESPMSLLTLSQGLWVDATEVTQHHHRAWTGLNPSSFRDCEDCPVENVRWDDAALAANARSAADGLSACYRCADDDCLPERPCTGWRLPTEAEWELLARCGEDLVFAGSDRIDLVGWYDQNALGSTQPVAQLAPNACGLYDLTGNVWEWVEDVYGVTYYAEAPLVDPPGPAGERPRVFRGGAYSSRPNHHRVSNRTAEDPSYRYNGLGYRLVRTAQD